MRRHSAVVSERLRMIIQGMDDVSLVDKHSPPATKIALFRSLFRGREDVYPRRFESRKTGKAGYAPRARTSGFAEFARSRALNARSVRIANSSPSPTTSFAGICRARTTRASPLSQACTRCSSTTRASSSPLTSTRRIGSRMQDGRGWSRRSARAQAAHPLRQISLYKPISYTVYGMPRRLASDVRFQGRHPPLRKSIQVGVCPPIGTAR